MKHWIIRDRAGKRSFKVLDPGACPSAKLTVGASSMRRNPLADETVDRLVPGGLPFWDYHYEQHHGAACAYDPWGEPPDVRSLMCEVLEHHQCTLEHDEDGYTTYVTAPPGGYDFVANIVSGVFHYYCALARERLYPYGNPFEIPEAKRKPIRVGMPGGGSRIVTPWFWFRMGDRPRTGHRMDDPSLVPVILEALEAFPRFPPALLMLFRLMAQGLARLSEQTALTVLDWWKSKFGTVIATPNKGDMGKRTKDQLVEEEFAAAMRSWFDRLRVCKHPKYRTLKQWQAFLEDEDVPWSERERVAAAEPLFTNHRGKHYTSSGARKWYRKAVLAAKKAADAPPVSTRTHYLRHAGVNNFLCLVRNDPDLTPEEKQSKKELFAEHMGWKWLETIENYCAPERQQEKLAIAREFLDGLRRNSERVAAGHGSLLKADILKPSNDDRQMMDRFEQFRMAA